MNEPQSRKDLEDLGTALLRDFGFVVGRMTDRRRALPGMVGWPDIVALYKDSTWFLEVKFGADKIRKSQQDFKEQIKPLLGSHLHYRVVSDLSDFEKVIKYEDVRRSS